MRTLEIRNLSPSRSNLRRVTAPFLVSLSLCLALASNLSVADQQVIADGVASPESVARGQDGRLYVSQIGKSGVDGDGSLAVIENGKAKIFAKGLDDPKGIVAVGPDFYVADKTRVWKVDATGTATVFAAADAFPVKPLFLNDIEASPQGDLYVSDCGKFVSDGAVFCIKPSTKEITVVVSQKTAPQLKAPNGLLFDGNGRLLLVDFSAGRLYRADLADGKLVELARGVGGADGLTRDAKGRIYVSDWRGGKVYVMNSDSDKPKLLLKGFKNAADIFFDAKSGKLLVPDTKAGTITAVSLED
ncbi:MAG TPA: SMP-30/gluconolactonase/LRE family protein [Planctomycetaceae bacterium]|jgi:gluconolactonase|nr:SMP-30/gluconolactonase/LRE family protein [Planctomycetaceae bacterium]